METDNFTENIKEVILNDTNISEECKEVISKISYSSLLEMQTSLQNYKKFSYVELFDVLSTVMIFVEGITLNNKKLSGETKKKIVVYLSRFYITTYIQNEDFVKLYDEHADDIIEKIVYSSVFLNVHNNIQNKCCNIF